MTKLNFIQLDPRTPKDQQPSYDLGIEVTILGMKNDVDHHGEKGHLPSAAEQVLESSQEILQTISWETFTLATVRPDSDSVTAMAVINLAHQGKENAIDKKLVRLVWVLDRLWPQWLSKEDKDEETHKKIIAIGYISGDFTMSLEQKVQLVSEILLWTIDPSLLEKYWEKKQKEYEEAKTHLSIQEIIPGKLVFVQWSHRMAMSIWYEYGTTVIALNPSMPVLASQDGKMVPTWETYIKYTIAKYNEVVPTDIDAMLKELSTLETWRGGRWTIIWSPQNVSSTLSPDQVIAIVQKYLG